MDNKFVSMLIAGFVCIIIGASLITVIATQEQLVTTKTNIDGETLSIAPARLVNGSLNSSVDLTIAQAPTGWKATDCPITGFILYNQSGDAMTLTTDYTVTLATGIVNVNNVDYLNQTDGNSTTIDYYYCADDYLNAKWFRTVLDLVPCFFALALFGVGLLLMYSALKGMDKI